MTSVRSVCEDLADQLSSAGWSIVTASGKPGRLARTSDMVVTTWRRKRDYSVAHVEVYSGPAFIWAVTVCESLKLLGKPIVLTLHGGNLPVFARKWPGQVRRLLDSAHTVTTPSPFLIEEMRSYRDDILLIPNPINIAAYDFSPRERLQPRLVWLRAFHEMYNPGLAPRAIAMLTQELPDISLIMIGPDKGDGSLQRTMRLAEELGVKDRISFPGAIAKSDVPAWLNRGDIFLNTTNVDNTPVSVVEAMACGLSVISTKVGGVPYLLDDERDALLVAPDDPAAMASAIRRLVDDPGLASALSRNGREKAERLDWAGILPQWERIFYEAERDR